MTAGIVRWVTGWWPRSEAERFADRMWPDRLAPQDASSEPLIGDDSFHYCAPAATPAAGVGPGVVSAGSPTTAPTPGHLLIGSMIERHFISRVSEDVTCRCGWAGEGFAAHAFHVSCLVLNRFQDEATP